MSGFFSSLGGVRDDQEQEQEHHQQQQQLPSAANSLFLYRSEEICKQQQGLDIWQQQQFYRQQQQQYQSRDQHHHHHHIISYATPPPSLMAPSYSRKLSFNISSDASSSKSGGGMFTVMRGTNSGGSGGGMNCQDCGNQAKKDCPHLRCRTCCKSRGFQCQTHIKSTWVPASKRRERQQQQHQSDQQLHLRSQDFTLKRPRDQELTTTNTSGLDLSNIFPSEVNSQAMFQCVRVSSMDLEHNADEERRNQEEQFAYQTAVSIAGHVFKGILYDQGPENRYVESSSGNGSGTYQQAQLNLITSEATTTAVSTQTLLDGSLNYPTPINAFMAGTQFFPLSRS